MYGRKDLFVRLLLQPPGRKEGSRQASGLAENCYIKVVPCLSAWWICFIYSLLDSETDFACQKADWFRHKQQQQKQQRQAVYESVAASSHSCLMPQMSLLIFFSSLTSSTYFQLLSLQREAALISEDFVNLEMISIMLLSISYYVFF